MRRIFFLAAVVTSLSANAAERLDIDGAYGDEAGCRFVKSKSGLDWHEGALYLTADRFAGYEWSCSFQWIGGGTDEFGPRAWSAIALCYAESDAYSSVVTIQESGDDMILRRDGAEDKILKRC